MSRLHYFILVGTLATIGLGVFLYKVIALHFPLSPDTESSIWTVEARVSFSARNKPVKVTIQIPKSTDRFVVMDENFISQGFGLSTSAVDGNRQAVWSIRRALGSQNLYYRAVIRQTDLHESKGSSKPPTISEPSFEGAALAAADAVIAESRAKSADNDSLTTALLQRLNRVGGDENVAFLVGNHSSELSRIELAVNLLARAGLPARIVHGIRLQDQSRNALLVPWLEVYDEGRWHAHDPITGQRGIPDNYFAWWHGSLPQVELKGGDTLRTLVSVESQHEDAIRAALISSERATPLLLSFSLFSLPIQAQLVYRVLLLVPIGGFLVVLLRNVVGIKTFGTFMPVLIALAFRETRLAGGIVLFTVLVALGLAVRFYLEHLKLLLVPRLASVLTVVVLMMAMMSVLTHRLGIELGLSVALFPMVILTMTIERMSILWEELGPAAALKQGLGTLIVASVVYLVITWRSLEHLVFFFPELLLFVLAGTLLLGRYTGYRLLELPRFKALAKDE